MEECTMDKFDEIISEIDNTDPKDRKPSTGTCMSKRRIIKNMTVLCLAYVFLFSAVMALADLQSITTGTKDIEIELQTAVYGALIVSSLFLPKLVIRVIGCKHTILLSLLMYSPYVASNFSVKTTVLLPTALLSGVGAATLWSSTCTYVNELSLQYANEDLDKAASVTPMFFGVFLMCFQTTQVWGILASFYALGTDVGVSPPRNQSEVSRVDTCGISFCGDFLPQTQLVSDSKRYTLVGIYLSLSLLSAIVLGTCLNPLDRKEIPKAVGKNVVRNLFATFRHIARVDQLLLIALTTFSGLGRGFILNDYSQAYVACAWGREKVGLVFVCYGVVNAIVSVWCGRLVNFLPRAVLMTLAATCNIGVCIDLFTWRPDRYHASNFLIVVGFWAFSDAIWQTQLTALYGVLFRSDAEAAFANYRLWEALGYLISIGCSNFLCTSSKIYMQIAFLIAGMSGYVVVELRTLRRKKCYFVTNPMLY